MQQVLEVGEAASEVSGKIEWLAELPSLRLLLLKALFKRGRRTERNSVVPALSVGIRNVALSRLNSREFSSVAGLDVSEGCFPWVAPHVLAAPLHLWLLTRPECPLRPMGLVHVWNRIRVTSALPHDALGDMVVRVGETRQVRKGIEVDVHASLSVSGEVVWESTSRIFSRGAGDAQAPRTEFPSPDWVHARHETLALSRDLGRRYAKVSGDYNPIHLFGWTARLLGFRKAIVHGMWTFARCSRYLPAPPWSYEAWFIKPLFLPGEYRLTVSDTGWVRIDEGDGTASAFLGCMKKGE